MAEVSDEALAVLRHAYEKVKFHPEAKPDGWALMLDLRQAVQHVIPVEKDGFRDAMVERGARALALAQSGVDEWDNYDPAFQQQLLEQARKIIDAALTVPR